MQLEDDLDRVSPDVIRLKGHRIGIEDVIARYHPDESMEQMALAFPGVSLAQLYATIAYYLHHRAAIAAYLDRVNAAYRGWMESDDAHLPHR